MQTLIVYDTFFGNTEEIAYSIGTVLFTRKLAEIYKVGDIRNDQIKGIELLVVGSPTRGFLPTKAILEFINGFTPNSLDGVKVVAFDTRTLMNDKVPGILKLFARLFGYAAEKIAARLEKKGGKLILPPEGFMVEGSEGPLVANELKRAEKWGRQIKSIG